jgi:hypothetical protein
VGDGEARARLLGEVLRGLELVHGLEADLTDHGHQHEVALEGDAGVADRLGGEEPGGHRALVVADAVTHEHVALTPRRMEDRVGRAPRRPPLVPMDGRVHVAVEDEALAVTGARERADHVRAIGQERDLLRREALAGEPVVHVRADRSLAPRWAVDVSEVESDLDQLVDVDTVEDSLRERVCRHREGSCGRPSSGSGSLF